MNAVTLVKLKFCSFSINTTLQISGAVLYSLYRGIMRSWLHTFNTMAHFLRSQQPFKRTVVVLRDGVTCDAEKNTLYIWETRDLRREDFLESAYLDSIQQIPMGIPSKTKLSKRGSFSPDFLLQKDECSHQTVAFVCVWVIPRSSFWSRRPVNTNLLAYRTTLLEGVPIPYFLISHDWQ